MRKKALIYLSFVFFIFSLTSCNLIKKLKASNSENIYVSGNFLVEEQSSLEYTLKELSAIQLNKDEDAFKKILNPCVTKDMSEDEFASTSEKFFNFKYMMSCYSNYGCHIYKNGDVYTLKMNFRYEYESGKFAGARIISTISTDPDSTDTGIKYIWFYYFDEVYEKGLPEWYGTEQYGLHVEYEY